MAKKNVPVRTWESEWKLDWHWFAFGILCDIPGNVYMIQLGFLHYMGCFVTKYPVKKGKKK